MSQFSKLEHLAVAARRVAPQTMFDVAGHSTVRVTKDVYGHLLDEQRKVTADAKGRILSTMDDEGDDGCDGVLATT